MSQGQARLAQPRVRVRRAAGLGTALLAVLLSLLLMQWLSEGLNPDWQGYALLYQDAGAWLAEQGRDPLFLLFIGLGSALLGPDGYLAFRVLVGLYFALFLFWLLRRPFGPPELPRQGAWLLLLGLLPFVAPRFTIQIREGLALTLVLAGAAWLSRAHAPGSSAGPAAGVQAGLRGLAAGAARHPVWPAVLLFLAASAMHSASAVLLAALLGGLLLRLLCSDTVRLELWLLLSISLAVTAGIALAALLLLATPAGLERVETLYGELADTEAELSLAKWAYWGLYGLGLLAFAAHVRRLYQQRALPSGLRQWLGMVALVFLPAVYLTALLLLANGLPAIVVAGAARVQNMLLAVGLLVLALRGQLSRRLGLLCLLVLLDQARVILEAVLGMGLVE